MVDGLLDGHVGGEDFLETPGHLQVAVPVVGVQEIEVARVGRRLDQSLHGDVGLGDVEAAHCEFLTLCGLVFARTCGRVSM